MDNGIGGQFIAKNALEFAVDQILPLWASSIITRKESC
jgi:hypothetical protein